MSLLRDPEPLGWRRVRDPTEDHEIRLNYAADNTTGDSDVDTHSRIVAITTTDAPLKFIGEMLRQENSDAPHRFLRKFRFIES